MVTQHCSAENTFCYWLLPLLAGLCLASASVLMPSGVLYAAYSQPQSEKTGPTLAFSQSQRVGPSKVPGDLSGDDWASIQKQITAGKYRAHKRDEAVFARHDQNLQFRHHLLEQF